MIADVAGGPRRAKSGHLHSAETCLGPRLGSRRAGALLKRPLVRLVAALWALTNPYPVAPYMGRHGSSRLCLVGLEAKRESGAPSGQAGAAPATVSGERLSSWSLVRECIGKADSRSDPRARRPAATNERPRAGCPGGSLAPSGARQGFSRKSSARHPPQHRGVADVFRRRFRCLNHPVRPRDGTGSRSRPVTAR
jgi:hypothetical protein